MKLKSLIPRLVLQLMTWPLLLAALTGCDRGEIKVYKVSKTEAPPAPEAAPSDEAMPHDHPAAPRARPQISWTLPSGWTEGAAKRMSLATFDIAGSGGQRAEVNVTPLMGLAGKEVAIVNMWRTQVGQAELPPDEVTKQLQPVDVGGTAGKMFEVQGKSEDGRAMKIVTAMIHNGDESWFYKLQGDAPLVDAQKEAFVEFLKSIKIAAAAKSETAPPPVAKTEATSATGSKWNPPAGWKEVAPGTMQIAKFSVPEKGSAKADVTISVFPSSTGGALANVNRWRGQIQLPAIDEAELKKILTPLDPSNPEAVLVDLKNNDRQLIGAIVPRDGQWFFFKLLGDAAAVTPQKEAFTQFAKSPQN
jgi:hypothetical protein